MGLDQNAFFCKDAKALEKAESVFYWRKHPNLQGWMEELYREKGGEEEFNCVSVELTLEDVCRLEGALRANPNSVKYITGEETPHEEVEGLPKTGGFFFGDDSDVHYLDQDLKFVRSAKEAIKDGLKVFYNSWW